ncbi:MULTISPECIES: hypothetical protein [Leuconostoc]|uniref:Uncharacterized protein n=2 Tax=Leuconostoc kimchii TaxID=136609 RepID=D5T1U6_LEUKI|nr:MULTISPECIES: hypothetical protein [Leuconostoc]ADG40245.1 hypothetical protein LKI_03515 [Leuconostoc kimchii IMSNU 11154]AEJ31815.1 hypothetical protein LGMK_08830 [Leuconostoc sp. C2]QBR46756.1 hypothetical protein EW139_00900 [Leuconostoc kimchii]
MAYRRIDTPHISEPVGSVREHDGLLIDDDNNVFEYSNNGYLKVGYYNPVSSVLSDVAPIGLGLLLLNVLFPVRSKNGSTSVASGAFSLFTMFVSLFFAYGMIIGWIVQKIALHFAEKIGNFLNTNKTARLLVPNFWFTDKKISKFFGFYYLGLPIFLLIFVILNLFFDIQDGTGLYALNALNMFSLVFSIICGIINIFYNLLTKVTSI